MLTFCEFRPEQQLRCTHAFQVNTFVSHGKVHTKQLVTSVQKVGVKYTTVTVSMHVPLHKQHMFPYESLLWKCMNPYYGNVLEGPFFLDFFVKDSLYMFRNVRKCNQTSWKYGPSNIYICLGNVQEIYTFRPVIQYIHYLIPMQ